MKLHSYGSAQDLPAHLRGYIRSAPGVRFPCFHHPFLVDILPLGYPEPIEDVLRARKQRAAERLDEGDLASYLFCHQRPYRMLELLRLVRAGQFGADLRSSIRFWRLLSTIWIDAEENESSPIWGLLLAAPYPARSAMSTSAERRLLRALPERVTVFRGIQAEDCQTALDGASVGFSWTLSRKTAEFFAKRHLRPNMSPWIATTQVDRSRIIALLARRGESEAIIDSDQLNPKDIQMEKLPHEHRESEELISLRAFFAE